MIHSRRMVELAGLARRHLEGAAPLAVASVLRDAAPDGGFRDRGGASDLYYTMFGIQSLLALGQNLPESQIVRYLTSFGSGETLDFLHVACLARCWSWFPEKAPRDRGRALLDRIETFRSCDGGYRSVPNSPQGSLYGCFLAHTAYQDLHAAAPSLRKLARSVAALRTPDGAYANEPGQKTGSTTSVTGVLLMASDAGVKPDRAAVDWLLCRHHAEGGFFASPDAPAPDLVSTATALYALRVCGMPLDRIREDCRRYVESLWCEGGGFSAHWLEEKPDCEHTFDGLLSLGCLEE
jgi:hypothetical protein